MRNVILLVFLMMTSLSLQANGNKTGKHLFILSGQSNMARLDPRASFIPAVEQEFGAENVIVVKDAVGGQPIRKWYKEWKPAAGDEPKADPVLYERLMKKVKAAVGDSPVETVTFVWMQGERDARESHGEVYAESLRGVLDQVRADTGHQDINFVIGRISDFDMANARYPHWTMVRETQVSVAESDPRGAWVDTDDLNGPGNDLHYTKEGYRILGDRFAAAAIDLIKKK